MATVIAFPCAAAQAPAWRARAVDGRLREALVVAVDAPDEDAAASALAGLFFGHNRSTRLPPSDSLRLAALAHALRTCLSSTRASAGAWSVAADIVHDLTLRAAGSPHAAE